VGLWHSPLLVVYQAEIEIQMDRVELAKMQPFSGLGLEGSVDSYSPHASIITEQLLAEQSTGESQYCKKNKEGTCTRLFAIDKKIWAVTEKKLWPTPLPPSHHPVNSDRTQLTK
jgi:hypothetical protein